MAKKKQKISGTNLRVLSIAYSSGRLDRNTYLKLRTQQLGALEFGKPLPELPDNLLKINIPTIKVDAAQLNIKRHSAVNKRRFLYLLAGVLTIVAIVGGLWLADIFPGNPDKPRQIRQLEPEDYARRLLQNPDWNERDINAFLSTWAIRTATAKTSARNSQWYLSLENEIIKRINKARLHLEADPESLPAQRELAKLRRFYGQLSSD